MKLRKNIQYYNTGEISYVILRNEEGCQQGEYIEFNKGGSILLRSFIKDGLSIGKYYYNEKYYFSSFINPGKKITESEHKKELAMVRLGLIEEPIQFSFLLKDYDENGKIK